MVLNNRGWSGVSKEGEQRKRKMDDDMDHEHERQGRQEEIKKDDLEEEDQEEEKMEKFFALIRSSREMRELMMRRSLLSSNNNNNNHDEGPSGLMRHAHETTSVVDEDHGKMIITTATATVNVMEWNPSFQPEDFFQSNVNIDQAAGPSNHKQDIIVHLHQEQKKQRQDGIDANGSLDLNLSL